MTGLSSSSRGGTTSAARAEGGDHLRSFSLDQDSSSLFDMQSMMTALLKTEQRVETLETRMGAFENQVSELKLLLGEPSKWDKVKDSVKDMVATIQDLSKTWMIKNDDMLSRINLLQKAIKKMEEESMLRGELLLHLDNVQSHIDNQMKLLGEQVEGDGAAKIGALNEARDCYLKTEDVEMEPQLVNLLPKYTTNTFVISCGIIIKSMWKSKLLTRLVTVQVSI